MTTEFQTHARTDWREVLRAGTVIPAHPLALTAGRKLDERRQRALSRYYLAAGAGGLAVGVHTTQFQIRETSVGLLRPVLELAAEEARRAQQRLPRELVLVGGICGNTAQAVEEAGLLAELGYHAGLLSLAALKQASEDELIDHCRAVGEVLPVMGFYLQPAVGGRVLEYGFWRRFFDLPNVAAVKVAAFDRYRTLEVLRAAAASGREDVALYTGNDDSIVVDLLSGFRFAVDGRTVERRFVGGLLGHWAVWTKPAVEVFNRCRALAESGRAVPAKMLSLAAEVTDCNAAFFDAANGFAGCIAGIHEVLRRQGLLEGTWCLDENERLSPGQAEQIDRVHAAYPHLHDDAFVANGLDEWLSG
jgi:dihydrodipicolinate synthase/N-acetylneuraminate lyase